MGKIVLGIVAFATVAAAGILLRWRRPELAPATTGADTTYKVEDLYNAGL